MLFPVFRQYLYVDESLSFYDEYVDQRFTLESLAFKDSQSRLRLDLTKVGINYQPTIISAYKNLVLGSPISSNSIGFADGNTENFRINNLRFQGRPLMTALEFRSENIKSPTPEESRLYELAFSKQMRKSLKKNVRTYGTQSKLIFITPEAIIPHETSFYLVDLLISGSFRSVAVELDGFHHFTDSGLKYDAKRNEDLKILYNIDTLRYENSLFMRASDEDILDKLTLMTRKTRHQTISVSNLGSHTLTRLSISDLSIDSIIEAVRSLGVFKFCVIKLVDFTTIDIATFSSGSPRVFESLKTLRLDSTLDVNLKYKLDYSDVKTLEGWQSGQMQRI